MKEKKKLTRVRSGQFQLPFCSGIPVGIPELFTPPPIPEGILPSPKVLVGDQDSWWIPDRVLVEDQDSWWISGRVGFLVQSPPS